MTDQADNSGKADPDDLARRFVTTHEIVHSFGHMLSRSHPPHPPHAPGHGPWSNFDPMRNPNLTPEDVEQMRRTWDQHWVNDFYGEALPDSEESGESEG